MTLTASESASTTASAGPAPRSWRDDFVSANRANLSVRFLFSLVAALHSSHLFRPASA
jgi:hypothetical protein